MKKLITLLVLVLMIGGAYTYDYLRSKSIEIQVMQVNPESIVADPNKSVEIKLQVLKNGKPAAGHEIAALIVGSGNLKADRLKVDQEGRVQFIYYPYRYLEGVVEESTVQLEFRDVSDSVLIAVQQPKRLQLEVKKPDSQSSSEFNMDSIFGE